MCAHTFLSQSMKLLITTLSSLLISSALSLAQNTCYARLEGDTLRVGNSCIERVFAWNGGALRTLWLTDKASGRTMKSRHDLPDFILAKEAPENARLEVIEVPQGRWAPACLLARVSYNIGKVQIRREYRLYDNVPAIACDTYIKGIWNITPEETPVLDQISLKG